MSKITYLSNNLNKFFNEKANEVSIETGFIKSKEEAKRFIVRKSDNPW